MADAGYAEAVALYRAGQLYTCLEACERLISQNPDHAPTLHLVGLLCYRGGDAETAALYFTKAIAADPYFPEPYPDLALLLKKQDRIDEAIDTYRKGLDLDPANPQAQYNYGLALRMAGRDRESAAAFLEAVTLNPLIPDGFIALGQVEAALGSDAAALDSFRKAIAAEPENPGAYRNLAAIARRTDQGHVAIDALFLGHRILGTVQIGCDLAGLLEEQSRPDEALAVLHGMTESAPDDADLWEAFGEFYFRQHRFQDSLDAFNRAVAIDPSRAAIYLRLYAVAQIIGNPQLALEYQAQALAITRLFTEIGPDPSRPHLLVLKAPGDWQINLPTDFIVPRQDWGALHHYFVRPDDDFPAEDLPPVDAIFSAVAEPDRARPELAAAQSIIDTLGLPALNQPNRVAGTGREDIAAALADLPGCIVPATFRLEQSPDQSNVLSRLNALLDQGALRCPFLLRPAGTHAGQGLVLIEDRTTLPQSIDAAISAFYATQYVDYRGTDGLFRKYRVIVVDGIPYPFHMGLSKRWMVHYYNSEPDSQAHMDREEERFLSAFTEVFPEVARAAFAEMHHRLGLDFFGVDCGLSADGTLILFEVDVGVIVHLMDDPVRYAYKHRHVPAIFRAVRAMIESRIASPASPIATS